MTCSCSINFVQCISCMSCSIVCTSMSHVWELSPLEVVDNVLAIVRVSKLRAKLATTQSNQICCFFIAEFASKYETATFWVYHIQTTDYQIQIIRIYFSCLCERHFETITLAWLSRLSFTLARDLTLGDDNSLSADITSRCCCVSCGLCLLTAKLSPSDVMKLSVWLS